MQSEGLVERLSNFVVNEDDLAFNKVMEWRNL